MKQLDPKAVYLFFFKSIARSIVPLIFLFIVVGPQYLILSQLPSSKANLGYSYGPFFGIFNWLWLIVPVIIILNYIWAELSYRYYHYELLDTGFRKESGVINKKSVTIPYDRIQNVNIDRGVVARLFGLSDLSIETAGSSAIQTRYGYSAEGRLPAVSVEVAEQLRDELIARAHQSKNQGL